MVPCISRKRSEKNCAWQLVCHEKHRGYPAWRPVWIKILYSLHLDITDGVNLPAESKLGETKEKLHYGSLRSWQFFLKLSTNNVEWNVGCSKHFGFLHPHNTGSCNTNYKNRKSLHFKWTGLKQKWRLLECRKQWI